MPEYVVKMKAELENIQRLIPIPNNMWKMNIASSDGADCRNGITVSRGDVLELSGSKGDANFVIKWSNSKNQSYMKIIDKKGVSGEYTSSDTGKFITILVLECRGIEPVACIPGVDWIVQSRGGTMFENVDLSEGDWAEYDENHDDSISATEVVYVVEKC
eukprot:gene40978-55379_t